MGCRMPTCSGDLFWLHPAVLNKSAIHIRIRAVWQGTPHDRRNRVDDVAKLRFLCSDHRFSTTLLPHIGNRADEFEILGAVPLAWKRPRSGRHIPSDMIRDAAGLVLSNAATFGPE